MLGFAGSRWTVQHAEGYLKYAISVGLRLLVLEIWIGFVENNANTIISGLLNTVSQNATAAASGGHGLAAMGDVLNGYLYVLVFVLLLAWMTKKLPSIAGSILTGSSSLSGGELMGAAVAGGAMAAAAVATGGASLAAGGAGAGAGALGAGAGAAGSACWRWASWIWTASSWSTIASDMVQAMPCCKRWRNGCWENYAPEIPWLGWAATSLDCFSRVSSARMRLRTSACACWKCSASPSICKVKTSPFLPVSA